MVLAKWIVVKKPYELFHIGIPILIISFKLRMSVEQHNTKFEMPCLSSDQKKSNYETVRIQEALRELRR